MKNDIGKLRKQLQTDPSDTQARSDILHELIFSGASCSEEAKQNVIWFIKNKPGYEGQWPEWRICFIDPTDLKIAVELWKKQVKNHSSSIQILKNAAQFAAGLDQDFSIQSWKDVLKLSPEDNSAKEDLALALFYKETKSFEGFKLFTNLFDIGALSSIFSLSVAILCAFEVDERGSVKKWTEKLSKEINKNESQIMPEALYPGYSALIINSIFNKETDKIVLYLQRLEELKRFSFSNFVIFDDRTIRALKDFGYDKEARSYANKIVSTTDDREIKKLVSSIFAA